MAGYKLNYFSVYRKSDGYEVICGYSDDEDTVRTWIDMMKTRVDGFIKDPSEEVLGDLLDEDYLKEIEEHRLQNAKTERLVSA